MQMKSLKDIPAKITETLDVNALIPYPGHPFKLYEGERLGDMVRSIREFGVLQPVIVTAATRCPAIAEQKCP